MEKKDLPAISTDDITLDLGDIDVATESFHISGSGSIDTITLDSIDLSNMSTSSITIPSTSYSAYNWSPSTTGAYTINTTNTWSNPSVNITSNGIVMPSGSDIKIDGQSLKEFMNKMEQRLAILVPDPKKLEKFEALKKAYEHYKTMESLCFDEEKEEK
jgi:hypothetical protein